MAPNTVSPGTPGPHNAATNVLLTGDWLSAWLPRLDVDELKAYLELAHYCNTKTYHSADELSAIFGDHTSQRLEQVLDRLTQKGLIEVVRKDGLFHYHFPHRDRDGYHRGIPVMPSINEALAFQLQMSQELLDISGRDLTEELRSKLFSRHPSLKVEYELYEELRDEDSPRWRAWLELSRHLLQEFETRFGPLKTAHNIVFREAAAEILKTKIAVLDQVTGDILEQRERIFPEVHDSWLVSLPDDEFVNHALVGHLAERYGLGPAQIFLNTLERIGQEGMAVAEVDEAGRLTNLVLPSTTGLTKSEERVLFLTPGERGLEEDDERNRERSRRAANKYANHLMASGVEVLRAFVKRDSINAFDLLLKRISDHVNESLEIVPNRYGINPINVAHVLAKYNELSDHEQTASSGQAGDDA